ncbi:MAG: ABC transporter ATP-binding protein [Lentisphaerae bacterium]|nr:ABC transporter ATP-binding protein [Lentisphaerota bacterium]
MNIAIRDLSFFRGERAILQNINADFADRSITALTGGNGCGKSTLLKLIAGLLKYQQGSITLNGRELNSFSPRQLARKRAILLQNPYAPPEMKVKELLRLSRYAFGNNSKYDHKIISQALNDTGCTKLAERKTGTLSGGELRKVFLAMALAQEPEVLLLDEVEAGMDAGFCCQLPEFLRQLVAQRNLSVVMVMHDLDLALHCATDILGIADRHITLQTANNKDAIDQLNKFVNGTMCISLERDGSIGAKLNYLK